MNLTEALAHSNNAYFEAVGRKLGFEKVSTTRINMDSANLRVITFRGSSWALIPKTEISPN